MSTTKWICKDHILLTSKYSGEIIYQQISKNIGATIGSLGARKGEEIIEPAAMPDHMHQYVAILPKYAVLDSAGYLKGKRSLKELKRPVCGEPVGKGK